jgi:hypothetical protein
VSRFSCPIFQSYLLICTGCLDGGAPAANTETLYYTAEPSCALALASSLDMARPGTGQSQALCSALRM